MNDQLRNCFVLIVQQRDLLPESFQEHIDTVDVILDEFAHNRLK